MTLSIICAFIGCWTPYFVVHLIHIWSAYKYVIAEYVYAFAETLALLNSAINPILYGFFNTQLKRIIADLCCPGTVTSPSTHRPLTTSPSENGTVVRTGRETIKLSPRSALRGCRSRSERRHAASTGPLSRTAESFREVPRRGTGSQRRQFFQTAETNVDDGADDDVRLRVKFAADRKDRQTPGSTGVC